MSAHDPTPRSGRGVLAEGVVSAIAANVSVPPRGIAPRVRLQLDQAGERLAKLGLGATAGHLQSIIDSMRANTDARALLESLVGQQIQTVTGRPNGVLEIEGDSVIVATGRSPAGQPVPIEWVENGIQRLRDEGEIEISVPSLGHRSAFVGAVLLTLPGAVAVQTTPPRVRLTDPASAYRLREAGRINTWWADDPRQRFWLEITDRPDIGVDPHCPQRDAAGNTNPGYSLIWWVEPGDVVFHYSLNERAIVAWSRAAGGVTEAPTVWLSHRGETRRRLQVARAQPGWWLDLDGPFPLDQPLTLAQLRDRADAIRARSRAAESGPLREPLLDVGFLCRQVIACLDAASTHCCARGSQLIPCALRESLHGHRAKHLVCRAQLLACVDPTVRSAAFMGRPWHNRLVEATRRIYGN